MKSKLTTKQTYEENSKILKQDYVLTCLRHQLHLE